MPRGEEVFKAEASRAAEGRANQGVPPHKRPGGGGPSRRPAESRKRGGGHGHGHNRGGHTPRQAAGPAGESRPGEGGSGNGGPGFPRKSTVVGSWGPKRRR